MKIRVRGKVYASVPEASKALNVTETTIYAALSTGKVDSLGIGRGRHGKQGPGARAVAVRLGPYQFQSIRHASRSLGLSRKYLTRYIRSRGIAASLESEHP